MRKNRNQGGAALQDKPKALVARARVAYPFEGEVIASRDYTLQVSGAGDAFQVDVSIDQGDWRACREALGLWWYDWSGFDAGPHEVIARIRNGTGDVTLTQTRRFEVRL